MKRKILSDIVTNFNEISGVEVLIGDNEKRCVCLSKASGELCAALHTCPSAMKICYASDLEHYEQIYRTGEPVRYTCPFGVEELLIPIKTHGEIKGFMFAVLGTSKSKSELDRYISFAEEATDLSRSLLERKYATLPHCSNEKVAAIDNILNHIADHIGSKELMPDEEYSVGMLIKNYIRDNISKKITLTDMAWHLHRSTVSLTEHFKAEFGMTIMEYVMQKRLKMAEEMLLTSDRLVKEIAMLSGFSDVEYFSRCFRLHYGKTPTEYRLSRGDKGEMSE